MPSCSLQEVAVVPIDGQHVNNDHLGEANQVERVENENANDIGGDKTQNEMHDADEKGTSIEADEAEYDEKQVTSVEADEAEQNEKQVTAFEAEEAEGDEKQVRVFEAEEAEEKPVTPVEKQFKPVDAGDEKQMQMKKTGFKVNCLGFM